MNEILQGILNRRSCKKFKPDMVPMEIIDQIIEAGLFAPNGMGKQSPVILAVTDKETRDKLSRLNRKYDPFKREDPFYGAPVVLVVIAPKNIPTYIYDGSLVMGNMLLAADALGIGGCWIHRAKESFADPEGKEILASLGIEGEFEGIGNCILGYPDVEKKEAAPRNPNRVFKI